MLSETLSQANSNFKKVGLEMGAILELTEKLKSPAGAVTAILIIVVAVVFVRWVFKDDEPKS